MPVENPVVICGDSIRHPERIEITGFRLQFVPHLMRGRNDKHMDNLWPV